MICIILAAGYATRMYPLTKTFPKPLLKVKGITILDRLIADIDPVSAITGIHIVTNHKFYAHFHAWLAKQSYQTPITIIDDGSTTNENRIGAVKDIQFALDSMTAPEDVLIAAGDNVLDFSLAGFIHFYEQKHKSMVMCYHEPVLQRQQKTGMITIDGNRHIISFDEKPQNPKSDLAVPPFYIYTAHDLELITQAIKGGLSEDALGSLIAWLSQRTNVYAWLMPGTRYDIGSMEGYERVENEFRSMFTP